MAINYESSVLADKYAELEISSFHEQQEETVVGGQTGSMTRSFLHITQDEFAFAQKETGVMEGHLGCL